MQGLFNQLREAEGVAVRDLCNEVGDKRPGVYVQLTTSTFLQLLSFWHDLRANARITAELDVACALARAAEDGGYIRPVMGME